MWVFPAHTLNIHRRCQDLRPGSAPVASDCEDAKVERIDVPISYRPNVQELMIRRTRHGARLGWVLALLLAIVAAPAAVRADGDRVAELSAQLDGERTEKERIAAVTALGRLNDKKALKPLVGALRDKSATVRAVAALSLGKLGHRAALPALREASNDDDSLVRKRAKEAVTLISEANDIEPEYAEDASAEKGKAGFGKSPKALATRPELYVVVKSATDDSNKATKGKAKAKAADKKDKKMHAEIAKLAMSTELKATQVVTSTPKDAAKYNLDLRNIDVIITKLDIKTSGTYIEVEAQLRLAISDDRGKMLSFLTGGAKVQVKKANYDTAYLPQLRREAIENAVKGLFDKLMAHLRRGAGA